MPAVLNSQPTTGPFVWCVEQKSRTARRMSRTHLLRTGWRHLTHEGSRCRSARRKRAWPSFLAGDTRRVGCGSRVSGGLHPCPDDGEEREVCRLFGMSAGGRRARATFWLFGAPDSLAEQSRREPDGTGLGRFDGHGAPHLSKQPIAAWGTRSSRARPARALPARSRPTSVSPRRACLSCATPTRSSRTGGRSRTTAW